MDFKKKRDREKEVLGEMLEIYCRGNHGEEGLCQDCKSLEDYSFKRIDSCRHIEDKSFCSACKSPCYGPEEREKIRKVMSYAGPRMVFKRPGLCLKHVFSKDFKLKKLIYVALGFIFMGIGAVGAVLPILPTVPFLMLASFFFMKGSVRFDTWFKSTKLYKKHLESFDKSRAMTRKTKFMILAFASLMLLIPFFKVDVLAMRVFIIFLIAFKYYYFIFKIKTIEQG